MNLAAVLRTAVAATVESGGIVISRAASPELKAAAATLPPVTEAPVLGGRTVWEAAPDGLACVETPNWWGRREVVPDRPALLIDRRHEEPGVDAAQRPDPAGWTHRTRRLASCLRTAGQIRGVVAAHGDPEAPWAILLLPIAAERVEARCAVAGVHDAVALSPRMPELPGGLRVAVPETGGSEWCRVVVASIAQEIGEIGGA